MGAGVDLKVHMPLPEGTLANCRAVGLLVGGGGG